MEYLNFQMMLILLGAILSATGSCIATYKQNQEKAQSAIQRAQFESELRAKSEEIAELNRTIAKSITGGDSYCYFRPANMHHQEVMLNLFHEGEYPLYDISVRIVDLQNSAVIQPSQNTVSLEEAFQGTQVISIGNLAPNQVRLLGHLALNGDSRGFNIFIIARNVSIRQLLRFKRIDGVWQFASKVIREGDKEEVMSEEAEPNFPRKDGQIEW